MIRLNSLNFRAGFDYIKDCRNERVRKTLRISTELEGELTSLLKRLQSHRCIPLKEAVSETIRLPDQGQKR